MIASKDGLSGYRTARLNRSSLFVTFVPGMLKVSEVERAGDRDILILPWERTVRAMRRDLFTKIVPPGGISQSGVGIKRRERESTRLDADLHVREAPR